MDIGGLGTIVVAVLGAGGIAGAIQAFGAYLHGRNQQPVDQYDKLVTTMQAMLDQEKKHCDEKYERLAGEHRTCMEKHVELTEQLGQLRGRLDEQRHMLATTVQHTKQNTETIALITDATSKR